MKLRSLFQRLTGMLRMQAVFKLEAQALRQQLYIDYDRERDAALWAKLDKCESMGTAVFRSVRDYLEAIGGKLLGSGCYSYAYRFDFPWGSVAIKVSYNTAGVNYPTRRELAANKALRKYFLRPLFVSKFVMIQPLCDTSNVRAISRTISNEIYEGDPDGGRTHDCHAGNVGFYKGQPRIFDAMSYERNR